MLITKDLPSKTAQNPLWGAEVGLATPSQGDLHFTAAGRNLQPIAQKVLEDPGAVSFQIH